MRGPLVRLQVRPLAEGGATELALIRPLARVRSLVVANLRLPGKCLSASAANERLEARVHDRVHL